MSGLVDRASERLPPAPVRDKPIKVLFVTGYLGLGGAEKNFVELVLGLDPSVVTARVMVLGGGGERQADLESAGVPLKVLAPHPLRAVQVLRRLAAIHAECRRFRPDVVHGFGTVAGFYAAAAGRLARVPGTVSGMRAGSFKRGTAIHIVQRLLWPLMDRIVCNSERGRRFLLDCGIPAARLQVIPNGLDLARMRVPTSLGSLRAELGIPEDRPLVGLVGKLNADKDPMTLVRAAVLVGAHRPDVAFCLIGSGPDRDRIRSFIAKERLDDTIFVVPERADAAWIGRELDIGVLSSKTEALPTAVTEYMYWRLPCVVTDVGDCASLVLDGRTGYVVPAGDPAEFAQALFQLLDDPESGRRMGERGRAHLEANYTLDRVLGEFMTLYRSLIPSNRVNA